MAERGARNAGSGGGGPEDAEQGGGVALPARPRRVVALRPTSGPGVAVAPDWAATSGGWADRDGDATGGWTPEPPRGASASALAESVFPFGSALPFEPDPEAAAFLNAPRRPLAFHVAPFGTPPFGITPPAGPRSVFGGPLEPAPAGHSGHSGRPGHRGPAGRAVAQEPSWGPAYPAGA